MCGIAGIVDPDVGPDVLKDSITRMTLALRHRGPDGHGRWIDSSCAIALGHTRLAIVDLTDDGRQPMVSRSGRLVITYNGEVYNFRALRDELEKQGRSFRGHSDTEVVLEAIEEWGLSAAIERFVGMFAFALWDRHTRHLSLIRDRVGKKPLYYSLSPSRVLFASELKAMRGITGFDTEIDRTALAQYFKFHYIPAPHSIYRGTRKLPAGSILTIDCSTGSPIALPIVRYWSPKSVFEASRRQPFQGSEHEAFENFEKLLSEAVKLRMVADVPLGAFLSGGVDSSTVVAHMQSLSTRPVRTFTIGTAHTGNEADHAAAVARHLGTDHTDLYVAPADALEVVSQLPRVYDEPFADSSQIPTLLVSRLARTHVTVGLSGDGGDEVCVGYNRYFLADRLRRIARAVPPSALRVGNGLCGRLSSSQWTRLLNRFRWVLPSRLRHTAADDRLGTLARMLASEWPCGIYDALVSHWDDDPQIVLGSNAIPDLASEGPRETNFRLWDDIVRYMVVEDQSSYLPDDILVKVDRASMSASLEARAPLLDHRIIEFVAALPLEMSLRGKVGKRLLRRSLDKHVPQSLTERPKTGFGIPIGDWLRGELRSWAEDLLSPKRLASDGILSPQAVQQAWLSHLSGKAQQQHRLWSVLMFQLWLDDSRCSATAGSNQAAYG